MKLACQENMAPGGSLEEKVANLERFGFAGIELWGSGLPSRVAEINRVVGGSSLKVSSICAGYRGAWLEASAEERAVAIADSKDLLSAGADVGATGLIMVPIFGGPRLPDLSPLKTARELERDLLLKLLDDVGQHAARVRCAVLVEPLNRYETHFLNRLEQATDIVRELGNPWVRIMADFFHMSVEERDLADALRRAGDQVWHVHLADSNRLLPGMGHTDFAPGFAALRQAGFDKYMALECGIPGDPFVELPESVAFLNRCLQA